MEYALFSAFTALIVALILTPVIRKFAVKFGIVAATNHRTIHSSQIPKLGGLSKVPRISICFGGFGSAALLWLASDFWMIFSP